MVKVWTVLLNAFRTASLHQNSCPSRRICESINSG